MSKTIRITYCGMDGEGPTVAAAKQDAARKLEKLAERVGQPPYIYTCGRFSALLAPTAEGWAFRLIVDDGTVRNGPVYLGSGGDYEDEMRRMVHHVATLAWSHDVTDDTAFAAGATDKLPLSARERSSLAREIVDYVGWQRRYRAARDQGHTDEDARYIAGGLAHMVKAPAA